MVTADFGGKPEEQELQVWVCGECDNSTFVLFNDARIQCAYCQDIICDECTDREGWRRVLPPSPEKAKETDAGTVRQMHVGGVDIARARVFRQIEGWQKDGTIQFMYGGRNDGATGAWVGVDNEKDRDDLLGQLDNFRAYIAGLKFDENASSDTGADAPTS